MKPIEKAERYTLSRLVVDNLKQYIVDYNIQPGEKLPAERKLSQDMKVSRAILREALRSLESSGILELRHGEGAFISSLSLNPLLEQMSFAAMRSDSNSRELLEIRYMLQASAIDEVLRRCIHLPFEELEQWAVRATEPIADTGEHVAAAQEADVQFHLTIIRTLQNDSLNQLADLFIRQVANANRNPDVRKPTSPIQIHNRLIHALKVPDANAAKAILREHLGILPQAFL